MIKKLSILFVALITLIIIFAMLTVFKITPLLATKAINIAGVLLLVTGIALIIALIVDRYRDYKNEGDEYKKY